MIGEVNNVIIVKFVWVQVDRPLLRDLSDLH